MTGMMPKRRPGPFGPAKALLTSGQEVLVVPETAPAGDALERMIDEDYSQVPVLDEAGSVTGVFSWKSFGKRVLDLRGNKLDATDLCVRDCMEEAVFVHPETYIDTDKATDWSQVDYVPSVDGTEVARTLVNMTVPAVFTASETFDVATDLGSPVSRDYFHRRPFRFDGKFERVRVAIK